MIMFETKDSGLLWVPQIPINWQVINLGRIGKFSSSGIDKLIKENEVPVKIINYTDIYRNKNMILDSSIDYMEVTCKFDKRQNNLVKVGDIIFTPSSETIDEIGMSAVVYEIVENLSFSYHVLRYQPHIEICLSFKKYMLNNHLLYNYFSSRAAGTIRQTLNRHDFKIAPVILPPIEEQKLIASFLDQKCSNIDSIINDLENQIEILEKYKKSVITEAVTKGLNPDAEMKDSGIKWIGNIPKHWDVSKVYRVCKIIRGNSAFQKDDLKNEGDYIGLQYGKTYKVNEVNNEYNYYVDSSFYKFNQVIISGYTIMVSTSETMEDLGHSCYYNRNDIGLLGGEQLALVPSEIFIGKFLYYASRYFKIELNQFATGIKVYRYKVNDLKNVNVIIPTLHEQTEIISFLDKKCAEIDSIIEDKKNQLETIKKYKNSLIYEYVTGKKRVGQGDVNE